MEEVHFTLEQPSYSMTAMLISNFILTTIVFSTVVFVLSSIPSLADSVVLNRCEASAIAILTIEYLLRLLCHRGLRLQFILNPFNMIDLMAVLPWYLELLDAEHLSALRILRILRLLRLLKHSEGLQMFLSCMARSLDGLYLLSILLCLAILIFSSLLWYAEKGRWSEELQAFIRSDGAPSPFDSIPHCFWWSIVTLTTVGYGDTYPVEPMGKLVAACAMLSGILVLALPLSIIGTTFTEVYEERAARKKAYALRSAIYGVDTAATLTRLVEELEQQQQALLKTLDTAALLCTSRLDAEATPEALLAVRLCQQQLETAAKAIGGSVGSASSLLRSSDFSRALQATETAEGRTADRDADMVAAPGIGPADKDSAQAVMSVMAA